MQSFKMDIPSPVQLVLDRLESAGHHAYCVGGCVRDSIMGEIPKDYDITTSARPEQMLEIFRDCRVVETGLKHGTVTVVLEEMNIEVTTYRIDGAYDDGRHPDSVTFTDKLSDDLCRRDFTINAMAYSPSRGLVDLYGGCEDLKKHTVRCVGRARERFSEDGLRILRALRFSSVLGFAPDEECSRAVMEMKHLLGRISRERIYAELTKLICGRGASRIIEGYPQVIGFSLGIGEGSVKRGGEIIRCDEELEKEPIVEMRYAALFELEDSSAAKKAFDSLKPSREESRAAERYLRYRGERDFSRYAVLRLMSTTDDGFPENLARYEHICGRISSSEYMAARETCETLIREDTPRRVSDLQISGEELIGMGMTGREIGETLRELLDAVMRGEVENSDSALRAAAAGRATKNKSAFKE